MTRGRRTGLLGAQRSGALLAAFVALSVVLVTGCSSHSSSARSTSSPNRSAVIGVLVPLSGPDADLGKGALASVQQAVDEADAENFVPGWSFSVEGFDDQGDQSVGQQLATRFVSDPAVIGVVGGLRSSVDLGVQPIFAEAGLAEISPGSTDPELTRREMGGVTMRPFTSYMRVSPSLAFEGDAGAHFIADDLHSTRVGVVNDGRTSGRTIAASVVRELRAEHVTVAWIDNIAPGSSTNQINSAVAQVRAAKVQSVYVAADVDVAQPLVEAMRSSAPQVAVVGSSSLLEPAFLASGAINGVWATYPGAPPSLLPSARPFLARYAQAKPGIPPGNDGPAAYDAAWTLIRAFQVLDPTTAKVTSADRGQIATGASAQAFAGATGPVSFDAYGDNRSQNFSFFRSSGQTWTPQTLVRVPASESP